MSLSGIVVIDKPAQWTSHDVAAKLRGMLKTKRIGHSGTLDPMATGVLPVFIGRATRAAQFCQSDDKEYIAGIKFGIVTDTQDITGRVLQEREAAVPAQNLKSVIAGFSGPQQQVPPMYSAIKQNGKKLYELARRGIETERMPRDIEIYSIDIIDDYLTQAGSSGMPSGSITDSDFYLRVSCSKGTYIRTLCHDIGNALGCGAVMSYLRRTRAGVFTIDMAHQLEDAHSAILPVDYVFSVHPVITLSDADARKVKNGTFHSLRQQNSNGQYRFYSNSGEFLLFGEVRGGKVKPIKSFFEI